MTATKSGLGRLQGVISLPGGVFKPYSGVGAAQLIFQKGRATQSVWFYDLTADDFGLDDKRTPVEANDIPDVLAKWETREEGPNSYCVPIGKIRENDWSLAAGRYKPVTTEVVNHDNPAEILADVLTLEKEILQRATLCLRSLPTRMGGAEVSPFDWAVLSLRTPSGTFAAQKALRV